MGVWIGCVMAVPSLTYLRCPAREAGCGKGEPRDRAGKRFPAVGRPMTMRTYRMLATSAVALLLTGCVVAQPVVVRRPPPPPPLRVEIAPVAPSPAHVWIA